MFKWRLYYDDGSTFCDLDGEPEESPAWGVIAAVQPFVDRKTYDQVVVGKNGDWLLYRIDLDYWHLIANVGLVDHLVHYGHLIGCVRPTRWMPDNDAFAKLWARAREDADV